MRAAATALLLLAAATVGAREPAPSAPVDAKALFLARCTACHDPSRVHHREADRDEWREIVDRMRRMPHSGISPSDGKILVDYLVSLRGGSAPETGARGGRAAYGDDWLSILETARVRDGKARLGGREYAVEVDGDAAILRHGGRAHRVALPGGGRAARTALVDRWRVGGARYEVHLLLYEVGGSAVRVARGLKRSG
ncbi:MAG: hypothetical protein ACREID_09170 [Planctomycetota bacterium]